MGRNPQVCVGGRPPTSGVEDNSERSTSSIGEVGETQFTVSRFEAFAGTQEAGPPVSTQGRSVRPVLCPKCNGNQCFPTRPLAAARARKFESALRTVGEDDETSIPDRIAATRSFLERSEKTRGGCAKAEALLEKEEALFKEGHQRLRQLLEKEKAMPSPIAHLLFQVPVWQQRLRGSGGTAAGACEGRAHDGFATCQENQVGRWRRQQILGINFWHRSCVRGRWIISQEAFLRDVSHIPDALAGMVFGLRGLGQSTFQDKGWRQIVVVSSDDEPLVSSQERGCKGPGHTD